jgi:phytoene dehydrogenase-like protein
MKKAVIIGGGISGMTAGILLQKAGFETEIYEKNSVPGGQCTGWKREGYTIDNCVHWLTGSKPGTELYNLWSEIGVLRGDGTVKKTSDGKMLLDKADSGIYKKEVFYSVELGGQILTLWRDKERTRKELLKLSPEDADEINKLIDYAAMAECVTVPVEKPMDKMKLGDYIKLGASMKEMPKIMKEYGKITIKELAERFNHPLIRFAITGYMPDNYLAYAFVVSYATVTAENGDVPLGGSLAMALRVADRYKELGGKLHLGTPVAKVLIEGKKTAGIELFDGTKIDSDYVICSSDMDHTFHKLLPESFMPKALKKEFEKREDYPVNSGFQIAFGIEDNFTGFVGTRLFDCEELVVGRQKVKHMSLMSYSFEPTFAPEGCVVMQTNFEQNEDDYEYWKALYEDKDKYNAKKAELAEEVVRRIVAKFPELSGKIKVLDVWTPMTYTRYCNSFKGAYMAFVERKGVKKYTIPGIVKGLDNVYLAGQWLMSPGGLPVALATGKYAAWRIINEK